MAKRILRRRRHASDADSTAEPSPSFPFTALPFELQLQIAHLAVQAPVPILVGRRPRPLCVPAALASAGDGHDPPPSAAALAAGAQRALAITQTCRALAPAAAPALARAYFAGNAFELGYYFASPNGFWTHPHAHTDIAHVVLDAWRLVRPAEGPNPAVEWLGELANLPGLRRATVRLWRLAEAQPPPEKPQEPAHMDMAAGVEVVVMSRRARQMLQDLCRHVRQLEVVECVVEATPWLTGHVEPWLREFESLARADMMADTSWPEGLPLGSRVPRLEV